MNCQNSKESAIKAGYPTKKAEKISQKLLLRKDISSFLGKLEPSLEKEKILKFLITALKKMVFYRSNDVFYLAKNFNTITKEEIEKLELFQIAEIKKIKDGTVEIKLIDRIKAVETILLILNKLENKMEVSSFFKALTKGDAYSDDDSI